MEEKTTMTLMKTVQLIRVKRKREDDSIPALILPNNSTLVEHNDKDSSYENSPKKQRFHLYTKLDHDENSCGEMELDPTKLLSIIQTNKDDKKGLKGTRISTFVTSQILDERPKNPCGNERSKDASKYFSSLSNENKNVIKDDETNTTLEIYDISQIPKNNRSRTDKLLDQLKSLNIVEENDEKIENDDDYVYDIYQISNNNIKSVKDIQNLGYSNYSNLGKLYWNGDNNNNYDDFFNELNKHDNNNLEHDDDEEEDVNYELDEDSNDENFWTNEYPDNYESDYDNSSDGLYNQSDNYDYDYY